MPPIDPLDPLSNEQGFELLDSLGKTLVSQEVQVDAEPEPLDPETLEELLLVCDRT